MFCYLFVDEDTDKQTIERVGGGDDGGGGQEHALHRENDDEDNDEKDEDNTDPKANHLGNFTDIFTDVILRTCQMLY